jgi:hypothetical protein
MRSQHGHRLLPSPAPSSRPARRTATCPKLPASGRSTAIASSRRPHPPADPQDAPRRPRRCRRADAAPPSPPPAARTLQQIRKTHRDVPEAAGERTQHRHRLLPPTRTLQQIRKTHRDVPEAAGERTQHRHRLLPPTRTLQQARKSHRDLPEAAGERTQHRHRLLPPTRTLEQIRKTHRDEVKARRAVPVESCSKALLRCLKISLVGEGRYGQFGCACPGPAGDIKRVVQFIDSSGPPGCNTRRNVVKVCRVGLPRTVSSSGRTAARASNMPPKRIISNAVNSISCSIG